MKGRIGSRLVMVIALVVAIANAYARGYRFPFVPRVPAEDTTAKKDSAVNDTARKLRFPIYDKTGHPMMDQQNPTSIDLQDPKNMQRSFDYDPNTKQYNYASKIGNDYLTSPTYLTMDEYMKYRAKEDENAYFQRRLDGLMLFNKTPELPQMYKEGLFDRIFGSSTISVKPQGNVDVTFGYSWQNIKNPTLPIRAQKVNNFDFDMAMNINLLATVGDKLKLNISNNTKATFDYQNMQKLDYNGKEDEMLKKLEAGNVSFPLKSNLITGVQSLFGIKTQLQFGKLWVTSVVSTQPSQRKSLTIQGGAQSQQIAIKANNYEENRNFLLSQYFVKNYNKAMKDYPIINSLVTINKVEVWVTNRNGIVGGVRDVLCFMDLGEGEPYQPFLNNGGGGIQNGLPDNRANRLYDQLQINPQGRQPKSASNVANTSLGLTPGTDFERTTARQLSPTEFTFNPQLGYIMLNTQMNPDDVLGVAYRYTYRGKVYQVGEFAADLPPDTSNPKVIFLKLLKGTSPRAALPVWRLMMKNVYALGGFGVSKENFMLNIMYQDPGGGEKRYMPEGSKGGTPFLTLLNLDHLNVQNEPQPDGIFDFVEGITINTQQGKIIFPVLEPFGNDLRPAVDNNPVLERRYIYQVLYDSTKWVAQQYQQQDRYIMRGSYKSSSSSDIFLGGFNIPPGSVNVSAGGTRLVENQDYSIEYGLGRIKILNTGILNSGVPINITYEDNATFGFQQKNVTAMRLDYYQSKDLTLGATFMRLKERPPTQKPTFGEDPIQNNVIGLDVNYQKETPGLTRLIDKLPVYSTTAPSFFNTNLEVAGLLPGHPKQINALDPEGSVYIDDFEGTSSTYDLKFPAVAWSLASTPFGATNRNGQTLFPEAALSNNHAYGMNRARLAWYGLDLNVVSPNGYTDFVINDSNQHYVRIVQTNQLFPNKSQMITPGGGALATFDLGFYPSERGPYNFDATNIDPDNGRLLNPERRWAGISRSIDNTDFEASNVQYIQFWLMDPFLKSGNPNGGSLYVNLGNVSEDVMKDSRLFFENGITSPFDASKLDTTVWGYVPKFEQQITRSFDNDNNARKLQDVGYDGLADVSLQGQLSEQDVFGKFLTQLRQKLTNGAANPAYQAVQADPASDNFRLFRDSAFSGPNSKEISVLTRYKHFNGPDGNSPITAANSSVVTAATAIPESEDINRDNTMNEAEAYFQYRIDFTRNMQVGTNYIISRRDTVVKLPNNTSENETWYQFKIPIQNYSNRVGGISDFRSIRFMRMFLTGFQDSVYLRFASLELGRNQWRTYNYSLMNPGEQLPQQNQNTTDFTVTSVSVEENNSRYPVPYVQPPGVQRQLLANPMSASPQGQQQNEQSLSLRACSLQDGDARGVFKEVNVDMRQFSYLRMFLHAEAMVGQAPIKNADISAFIRIGSDFTNNYYEYQTPLTLTDAGVSTMRDDLIWPAANNVNIQLQDLVDAKKERDAKGFPTHIPYRTKDSKGNVIVIIGTPNIGGGKNIMLGIMNPAKDNTRPGDDGLPKCVEVWFDEMRISGTNDQAGYAAAGKVTVQLADLGNVNLSGSMHTPGYGNIDQKIQQRFQDKFYQYNTASNLSLGKLFPRTWGVQLPLYVGYTQNVSIPKYNPFDQDVLLDHELSTARNQRARDSIRDAAIDFTSITSMNLSNVRIQGNQSKPQRMFWSIKNFDFTYAYNNQFKHNPLLEVDRLTTQRYGVGYTYAIKSKPYEPFRNAIKSKSRWLSLVKDININPLPSTFNMRNDLNRVTQEMQIRNIDDGSGYRIPPSFYKNFTWTRTYSLRWELMKSLSLDYNATNVSRIDEPYGKIDSKEKQDSLLRAVSSFGRNNSYTQTLNSTYTLPFAKLPLTDWVTARVGYTANYNWTTAPPIAYALGNTIGNTNTKTLTSEFNMTQLYNKSRWLKALNNKPRKPGESRVGGTKKDGEKKAPSSSSIMAKDGNKLSGDRGNDVDVIEGEEPATDDKDKKDKKDKKKKDKNDDDTAKAPETKLDKVKAAFPKLNTANMSDEQLDSLVKVQKELDKKKAVAEKKKKKKEKKAARKARKKLPLALTPAEHVIGHAITILNRVTLNVTETEGTILPGYMDSTRFMGVNNYSAAPGFDFVYGYQPDYAWLAAQSNANRLSRDSLFNAQFQQTYSRNINAQATLLPHKSFRVDLTLTQTFSKGHSELYADTGAASGEFAHLTPYQTGSFNITYISTKSMFRKTGVNTEIYNSFLDNRKIFSRRLGASNPYTNGLPDPLNPGYSKGYGPYSQDVIIPSFIAAYSGRDPNTAAMIDYKHDRVKENPFRYFIPLPNWRVNYTGLAKLPYFAKRMNDLQVTHAYTGTLAMNSFNSSLFFGDLYGLGFPSFIDSNSTNYVPFFQVPNVTLTQAFNPLIGFNAAFKNNLTGKFEVRRSKTQSLSLVDYQVGENASTEYVIGGGFRKKGIRLPFPVFGIKRLKNEAVFKLDIGIRDDRTTNTFLANNVSVTSRGQKVVRVNPTINYTVNDLLTLLIYFDRQQTIPYVSNAPPSSTTRAGVTLRFNFAP